MRKNPELRRIFAVLTAMIMVVAMIPFTAHAVGNEIYVSATGDDTTGAGTQAEPYATINKAYSVSASGDTIVLLSDIAQTSCVSIWHSLIIKSEDGHTYTVTRQAGFPTSYDNARLDYNPAMFELHPDQEEAVLYFENIVLDDNHVYEGTNYAKQSINSTGNNLGVVQDGIVSVYNALSNGGYKGTVILGDGTELKNFGGRAAVNVEGANELIMRNGSVIRGGTHTFSNAAAIISYGGIITMEDGSLITEVPSWVIDMENGSLSMNGIIRENTGCEVCIRFAANSTGEIGPTGLITLNSASIAPVYAFANNTVTIRGEISGNTGANRSSGVYAIVNGGNPTVYIEDGAKIINNIGTTTGAGILVGNGATVIMNGGLISGNTHDANQPNASGVNVYGYGTFTLNGGEIKDNQINVGLGTKSKGWAHIYGGTVSGGTVHDYIIEAKQEGFLTNGSYMHFNSAMIASQPDVYFTTNAKSIVPTTDMTELWLGNASGSAMTAFNGNTDITSGTLLATWFGKIGSGNKNFHVKVNGLDDTNDDVFVLMIPQHTDNSVDNTPRIYRAGKTTVGTKMEVDVNVPAYESATGYAFALFTNPNLYTVTFESNGGTYVAPEGVRANETAFEPAKPHMAGKVFGGWYTDDGTFASPYDFTTPVTSNFTLYAKWNNAPLVDLSPVTITKNITSPSIYSTITFTFDLEPYSVLPDNGTLDVADMPAIGPLSVTVSGTDSSASVTLPDNIPFVLGGVYTYKVTEIDDGAADWTYDGTVYYIDIEVEESAGGSIVLDKVIIHKDTPTGAKSSAVFTNIYSPNTDLVVSKTVVGTDGNPLNSQKEFSFSIVFHDPGTPGGVIVDVGGTPTAVAYETAYAFTLKNGESITFTAPVGTTYDVTELGTEYYTPSAEVVEGGTSAGTTNGTYKTDLSVGGTILDGGANRADYTNNYSITPPTGIKLNTEIILIGAVILGIIAASIIVSRRFRAKGGK